METLGELYRKRVCSPETQRVYISHGDCPEDAEQLHTFLAVAETLQMSEAARKLYVSQPH